MFNEEQNLFDEWDPVQEQISEIDQLIRNYKEEEGWDIFGFIEELKNLCSTNGVVDKQKFNDALRSLYLTSEL